MKVGVIKEGPYRPMQSPFSRDKYVLTLGCGHIWSYAGEPEGIPEEIDCIHYHDDRGLSARDPKLDWIGETIEKALGLPHDGLLNMEADVLHEKVLEQRLNGGKPLT